MQGPSETGGLVRMRGEGKGIFEQLRPGLRREKEEDGFQTGSDIFV